MTMTREEAEGLVNHYRRAVKWLTTIRERKETKTRKYADVLKDYSRVEDQLITALCASEVALKAEEE